MEVGAVDLDATVDFIKSFDEPIEYEAEGRISEVEYGVEFPFEDVPASDQAYSKIETLADEGVFDGLFGNSFDKHEQITSGEFIQALVNLLDIDSNEANPFDDVDGDVQAAVNAAYVAGITNGTTDSTFEPDKTLNRKEMAVIVVRAYE
ncbi:S-layer homology domain-containing protein [Alkalibacillus aidingensis]|uniref:S-layer homology domain-containing protein n=1 Tax=Alkalibacillus aidingensis TaxID=2747607 RepID=UPI0016602F5E|nr:S-layer homology domain-containing protein [Alkalibacillus aidingensis]